jgi:hypothetical protein
LGPQPSTAPSKSFSRTAQRPGKFNPAANEAQTPYKPSSAEQARINGAQSKGPITDEGKQRSSKNALKHGFAAKVNILIDPDDSEAWDTHIAGYHDSYLPINYAETEFVGQLASISWRQARLVGIETALIDLQITFQDEKVDEYFPDEKDNEYLKVALAWQGLARKAFPRIMPIDPTEPPDPTLPPDGLDIEGIELVRRYQVSLDRQFRNALLNFRQYHKDFAPNVQQQLQQELPVTLAPKPTVQPAGMGFPTPPQMLPTPNEPTRPPVQPVELTRKAPQEPAFQLERKAA